MKNSKAAAATQVGYTCLHCKQIFRNVKGMALHNKKIHSGIDSKKSVTCGICGNLFETKAHMELHNHEDGEPMSINKLEKLEAGMKTMKKKLARKLERKN